MGIELRDRGTKFRVTSQDADLFFTGYLHPDWIIAWRLDSIYNGIHNETCIALNPEEVVGGEATLKQMGIWDKLGVKTKERVIFGAEETKQEPQPKVERKDPIKTEEPEVKPIAAAITSSMSKLVCSKCGAVRATNSVQVHAQCKKLRMSVDNYLKNNLCRKCKKETVLPDVPKKRGRSAKVTVEPTTPVVTTTAPTTPVEGQVKKRGRPFSNPAGSMSKLVCSKCGVVRATNVTQVTNQAHKLRISVERYMKENVCRECKRKILD